MNSKNNAQILITTSISVWILRRTTAPTILLYQLLRYFGRDVHTEYSVFSFHFCLQILDFHLL